MARPKKQTVDYFPHSCNHGKTLYILEQKYQVRGYSFWFKLLEQLGKTEGHSLDLNNVEYLEFLSAITWFSTPETLEILDLLSRLGAIDQGLWKKRIVWCDNFIENIKGVYDKRSVSVPEKPVSVSETIVSGVDNPQSKVKESKVKENKINKESSTKIEQARVETEKENTSLKENPDGPLSVPAARAEYGNQKINDLLSLLREKIGVDDFKESVRYQRIWGKNLVSLMEKISPSEFGRRLEFLLDDDFMRKNCNKLEYIYREIKGFIEPESIIKSVII